MLEGSISKSLTTTLTGAMSQHVTEERDSLQGELPQDPKIPVCGEIKDPNVKVTLQNKDIWDKFHASGTEMIITKAGRYVSELIPMHQLSSICRMYQTILSIFVYMEARGKRRQSGKT